MPRIPLTAQTHSRVSGEGHLGKNKVSLTESSAGHEKPDGFVFPPPMSQCRKQGRAFFKTSTMWKKRTWKWVWVVLFIYCTTHLYTQKMLIYSWQSRQHTPEGSQTQAPLFCFDFLWVQAIAAESTHWQLTAVIATHNIMAHIYGLLTWNFYCLQWKKPIILT